MAGNAVVGIDIVARLDAFKAEMAKLGPEAAVAGKQIAAELSKGIKQNTAALNQQRTAAAAAAKATKDLGGGFKSLGDAGAREGTAIGPLGGVLNKISPAAGEAASAVAGLTGSVRAAGMAIGLSNPIMAALTVVLIAGGAAYAYLARESAKAEEAVKLAGEAATKAQASHAAFTAVLDAEGDRARLASGEITREALAQEKATQKINAQFDQRLANIRELERAGKIAAGAEFDMESALERRRDAELAQSAESFKSEQRLAGAKGATAKATAAQSEATKWYLDLLKMEQEEAEKTAQLEVDWLNWKITRARELRQQEHDEQEKAAETAAKEAEEWEEARVEAALAETEMLAAEQEKRLSDAQALGNSMSGFAVAVQDNIARAAEEGTEKQKEELRAQWKAMQALRAGEAAINAFAAMARAQADYIYPLSLAIGGLALGTGLAEVATILGTNPTFHTGTSNATGRPDEFNARLQTGEGVVSRQGMDRLGRDTVDRANSGRTPAPTEIRVVNQYRHKEYNAFMRDNLAAGGPTRDAINKGTVTGHRANRRG